MDQCISSTQALGGVQRQRLVQQVDKVGQQFGVLGLHLEKDICRRNQSGFQFTGCLVDDECLDGVL